MILVDSREKRRKTEKQELVSLIRHFGVKAETDLLPYGDFAFDGLDSHGPIAIGVERKTLHDMLACIEDSRLSAHQRLGMRNFYTESWCILEGVWRPHDPKGFLMEGDDQGKYWFCRPAGSAVLYSKLRRYLFSLQRAGLPILFSRDMTQTAYDICELYHYYQKKEHTAMMQLQKANIPTLQERAPLVQKWANDLEGIGVKLSGEAASIFKTPINLATSDWQDWVCIPGIGPQTAQDIVKQINGEKRKR